MADNFAQTVKQQTDIVRIVGEYIKLRKSGANWSALCPFHKEKSGSFYLYPATTSYYCFGCHEHGDVFTFVMKMENLSFPEAVRSVATKMGIPLPQREFNSPQEAQAAGLRKQLIDAHEAATQYFQQNLHSPEAARAREYMTGRGITPDTITKFRLGYAPDNFNDMRERLSKFFSEEVLRASGLFSWKEQEDGSPGPMYARFRKRITFPIMNEQGKPIAFTARALDSVDVDPKAGAKYMNSPETPLYTKGQVLFNLDKAKAAIKSKDAALLVEGQMDCISLFMNGVDNVIATSGTAFTEHQLRMLGRFTKRVWLNFDPDQAGANAAEKTLGLLVEEDFDVRVITLDGGLDPDRFVRERGVAEYATAVRNASRYQDFLIERARLQFPARTAEAKVKAMNFLLPHIRRIPNLISRNDFAENAAQKLGIESSLMRQELKQAAQQRLESVRAPQPKGVSEIERILLCALILPDADSSRILAAEQLAANPEWCTELSAATLIDVLANGPSPDNPLEAAPDAASRLLLASVLHHSSGESEASRETLYEQVQNALHTLHQRRLDRRLREVRTLIAEATRHGNQEVVMQLAHEKVQLDAELKRMDG
ncbi:DNA primase [Granulicella mallensis]|uniref:DNA primase n=1 Tax=Granulicella mallensis TaxID=940614 RepID=A0A7W7ZP80_9BACT|nr:DNA primase [Granulicella mallensis]MBB5063548.1 DNA primase [Granulicella mallensis]